MSTVAACVWSEEAGDPVAPLVALIHGSMDRSTGMLKLSRRLDRRFRVLRYDRRGYGRSIDCGGPYEMHQQVDDLIGLLAGRPALLVGHSYGGNVALATAARCPDLVRGVALYETPMSWEPWWPGTTAGSQATATRGTPAEAAERFMRRMVGDQLWDALPERTRATRRAEGPAMVGELRDLQANVPWQAEDVACPVVLAHGSRGAEHHRDGMARLHALLLGSVFVVLDGCRHDAPLSDADLFAAEIIDVLAAAAGPPWATAAVD